MCQFAASAVDQEGLRRLVSEVGMARARIVLDLAASRRPQQRRLASAAGDLRAVPYRAEPHGPAADTQPAGAAYRRYAPGW